MLECYDLPTANVKSGIYHTYVGDKVKTLDSGTPIQKLVFLQRSGMLEAGRVGIKFYIQISKEFKLEKPIANDIIDIDGKKYKVQNSLDRSGNPGFQPFWEMEVKELN